MLIWKVRVLTWIDIMVVTYLETISDVNTEYIITFSCLTDRKNNNLFRLLYLATSTVQRLEIFRVQSLEISRFCTLEISRHCTVEVDE